MTNSVDQNLTNFFTNTLNSSASTDFISPERWVQISEVVYRCVLPVLMAIALGSFYATIFFWNAYLIIPLAGSLLLTTFLWAVVDEPPSSKPLVPNSVGGSKNDEDWGFEEEDLHISSPSLSQGPASRNWGGWEAPSSHVKPPDSTQVTSPVHSAIDCQKLTIPIAVGNLQTSLNNFFHVYGLEHSKKAEKPNFIDQFSSKIEVTLNRFVGKETKNKLFIHVPLEALDKIMIQGNQYRVIKAVIHEGDSIESGKYTSVKRGKDGQWVKVNGKDEDSISPEEAVDKISPKEAIDRMRDGYIFFLEKFVK